MTPMFSNIKKSDRKLMTTLHRKCDPSDLARAIISANVKWEGKAK